MNLLPFISKEQKRRLDIAAKIKVILLEVNKLLTTAKELEKIMDEGEDTVVDGNKK